MENQVLEEDDVYNLVFIPKAEPHAGKLSGLRGDLEEFNDKDAIEGSLAG